MPRADHRASEEELEQRILERERHLMLLVTETRQRVRRGWRTSVAVGTGAALLVGLLGAWGLARGLSRASAGVLLVRARERAA